MKENLQAIIKLTKKKVYICDYLTNLTDNGEFLFNSDPRITGFGEDVVIMTIPQSVPHGETQCVWIVNGPTKLKVLNAAGYPARIPTPRPDLYELRSTPDMGEGLFAKRDISRGEIIFAERPLLVTHEFSQGATLLDLFGPQQKMHSGYECLLEAAIARLPPENQADFKALQNGYTADQCGPLLGRVRTDNYDLRNLFDGSDRSENYKAVNKIASRINHRCVLRLSFAKTGLTPCQLRAKCEVFLQGQLFLYAVLRATRHQSRRSTVLLLLSR